MVEKQPLQQTVLGQWLSHMQKTWVGSLTPYTKITWKSTLELNIKTKAIKLLEESIAVNFCDCELDNDFLDNTPKAYANKEKNN